MNWYSLLKPAMIRFRLARARRIKQHFPDIDTMNVLDLGGSIHFWNIVQEVIDPARLTILNVTEGGSAQAESANDRGRLVMLYDGDTVPFPDDHFDLVICNSVIEHVPESGRAKLVSEIERVGKRFVLQTPAYEFPLEPHLVAPFIHWLPRKLGRQLAPYTPCGVIGKMDGTAVFDEVNLLRHKEVVSLMPRAELVTERFLGLPKSYLAFGNAAPATR